MPDVPSRKSRVGDTRRRHSALREAAPCILTVVVFVIPLAVLVCLKFAQFVGYFPN